MSLQYPLFHGSFRHISPLLGKEMKINLKDVNIKKKKKIKNLHKDGNKVNVFMTADDKLNNKLKLYRIQTHIKNLIEISQSHKWLLDLHVGCYRIMENNIKICSTKCLYIQSRITDLHVTVIAKRCFFVSCYGKAAAEICTKRQFVFYWHIQYC